MALCAIGIKRLLQIASRIDVVAVPGSMAAAVAVVAPQAQERRGLPQEVVGHGTMWFVADSAVLRHRRMLINMRSLLLRMAFIAD